MYWSTHLTNFLHLIVSSVFRTCVTPSSVEPLKEKDITRQVLLLKEQHVEKENGVGLYLKHC